MGKRGPARKTTTHLKLVGSRLAKERANEPVAESGAPECPAFVAADALIFEEWKKACKSLEQMGILSTADRMTIACYAEAAAELSRTVALVLEAGLTTETDKGNVIQHPLVGIKNKAAERVGKFEAKLGLSPSSRSTVKTNPKPATSVPKRTRA